MVYAIRSARQARQAAGFRQGWLGRDPEWGVWTATLWDSMDAMRTYRNAPPHLQAMKKLLHWCDEAAYVHWESAEPPDAATAFTRLQSAGSLSKVLNPSARHREGRTVGASVPRIDNRLRPK